MPEARTRELQNELKLEAEYLARLAAWSDIQEQMPLLHAAASSYDRPVIAELGTRTGNSTCALLAGAAVTLGHVWSVDPGPAEVPGWWAVSGLWSFLAADALSDEAIAWLPRSLDILFTDTSHTYDQTLGELRRYAPRVRPGGVVLVHDPELTRTGDPRGQEYKDVYGGVMGGDWANAAASGPEYPVAAALDAYCQETGLTWERQADRPAPAPGMPFYGLGTILIP